MNKKAIAKVVMWWILVLALLVIILLIIGKISGRSFDLVDYMFEKLRFG